MSKAVNKAITSRNAALAARRSEIASEEQLGKAGTAFRRTGAQSASARGRTVAALCACAVKGRKSISVAELCDKIDISDLTPRVNAVPLTRATLPAFVHRAARWICERSMQARGERYIFGYSPEKKTFAIAIYAGKEQHDMFPFAQVAELARALPRAGSKPSVPLLPGPTEGTESEENAA